MAPAYVRDAGLKTQTGFSGTTTGSFASLPAVGNHVIVGTSLWRSGGSTMDSVSDNQSNAYNEDREVSALNGNGSIYSAKVATSSGTYTLTIDPTAADSLYIAWTAVEFSGLNATSHLDQTGANPETAPIGISANVTASGANTTTAGVAIGVAEVTANDADLNLGDTPPSGYTNIQVYEDGATINGFSMVYKIYSSSETSSAQWSHDNPTAWGAVIATYKGATGSTYTLSCATQTYAVRPIQPNTKITGVASSTGAKLPTAAASTSYSSWNGITWTNPTNIYTDNATNAAITAATYDLNVRSYALKGYTFDFSGIPDGSIINGVTCVVNIYYANGTASIDLLQLLDTSGNPTGTNQCSTPVALGTGTGGTVTKGSTSDTWGCALTSAWVKNTNFGVAIGTIATADNADVFVDYVSLDIQYTSPTRRVLGGTSESITLTGVAVTLSKGAGSTYTLSAALGTFTASGVATTLKRTRTMPASVRTYALTGVTAALKHGYKTEPNSRSFAVTGVAVTFRRTRILPAATQAYTETGIAATLKAARLLSASVRTYTETGVNASLIRSRLLSATAQTYAITGVSNALRFARLLNASAQTYTVTTVTAGLLKGKTLSVTAGSFAVTGIAAALRQTSVLQASTQTYALTGIDVTLTKVTVGVYSLTVSAGTLNETGIAAALKWSRVLGASAQTYNVTTIAAALLKGKTLSVTAGTFALSGVAVTFRRTRIMGADVQAYALTGISPALLRSRRMPAALGTYVLSGVTSGLYRGKLLSANAGMYTETGINAALLHYWICNAVAGAYSVTGIAATLGKSGAINPGMRHQHAAPRAVAVADPFSRQAATGVTAEAARYRAQKADPHTTEEG